MSECVVRMEMPTLEKGCKIAIGNEYMFCPIEARLCNFYELGGKCPSWCPLICSLPEGHGRLVDADELIAILRKKSKEFSDSKYGEGVKCGLADARDHIAKAQTIVPAERSET